MQNSYLFYDIETSGLNKSFDQVLQFAAIRTDLNFNELERHEFIVKLNPDVVPSPSAIMVNQLSLKEIHGGVCEYEAIKKIHGLFNRPGTISLGYNTLGFDDEFLRFSFYRNLLPPYTHQYASGCMRMDIYPMAVMYYLFKPDILYWPKIGSAISLRLENLSSCNQLASGRAHHAMVDVEATLELARRLRKDEETWKYLSGYFDKKTDLLRLDKIEQYQDQHQVVLLIDGSIGSDRYYQTCVIGIGGHNHYKNQSLWLPLDLFDLSRVEANNIAETTYVKRKRFGESPFLLPLTERFKRYINAERLELMTNNINWIGKNHELFLQLVRYHQDYKYPVIPNLDVDAALYQIGFASDTELAKCNVFHAASPDKKCCLADKFSSVNLKQQAIRVLGRNYPEQLAKKPELYAEFNRYTRLLESEKVMVNYKNEKRLTKQTALEEIKNLMDSKQINTKQRGLLTELSRYIQS